jgi:hypothetical protein
MPSSRLLPHPRQHRLLTSSDGCASPVCRRCRPFPYPNASRRAAGSLGRRCPRMRNPPHGARGAWWWLYPLRCAARADHPWMERGWTTVGEARCGQTSCRRP